MANEVSQVEYTFEELTRNEHPHTTRRAVRRAFGGSKAVYSTVTKLLAQGRLRETGLGELVAAVPGA